MEISECSARFFGRKVEGSEHTSERQEEEIIYFTGEPCYWAARGMTLSWVAKQVGGMSG